MGITGVSHITFIVRDLNAMSKFLCEGLGAEQVYDSNERNFSLSRERFYILGGMWIAAMEGDSSAELSYCHVAFQVSEEELPEVESRLRSIGVKIRSPRARVNGEGQSLYFYDFDNHLFELHTGTLDQRLRRYRDMP